MSRIYIIGAGAIGKTLAVFLKKEEKDVVLIRGREDNIPEYTEEIIVTDQIGQKHKEEITVSTFNNLDEINGIVLIATKSFSNEKIALKLKQKKGNYSIVLLQNGLNIETAFKGVNELYRCVLFSTGQVIDDNNLSFKTAASRTVTKVVRGNISTVTI